MYHDERSVYSLFDILKEFEEGLSDGLRGQSASRDALPDIIELIDAPTLALTVRQRRHLLLFRRSWSGRCTASRPA